MNEKLTEDEKKIFYALVNVLYYKTTPFSILGKTIPCLHRDQEDEDKIKKLRNRISILEKSLPHKPMTRSYEASFVCLFLQHQEGNFDKHPPIVHVACTNTIRFLEKIDKPFVDELRGYIKDIYDGKYKPKNNSWILEEKT